MIALASDHAGFALKEKLKNHLKENGYEYLDLGTDSEQSCHYPVFAKKLCEKINDGTCELGILVCGTGIGMSMAANKQKGIRAAACSDYFSAKFTRAQQCKRSLAGRTCSLLRSCRELVDVFLSTPFECGKHQLRIDMFED